RFSRDWSSDVCSSDLSYVPALEMDELLVFDKLKNPVHEYCESVRFLAYKDNLVVGRIAGIINHQYNKEFSTKTVRFSRIDMIDRSEERRVGKECRSR